MYPNVRLLIRLAATLGLSGLVVMCTPDRPAAPPQDGSPLTAAQVAAIDRRARLPHGWPDAAWVADFHTRAMQQAMALRRDLARQPRQVRCQNVLHLVRSFLPEVKRGSGVRDDALLERGIAAVRDHVGCAEAAPLSLFVMRTSVHGSLLVQDAYTDVTGAFEEYADLIESVIANATSIMEVEPAVDQVLVQAAGLPEPDFQLLSNMASLGVASAWYWYEYGVALGESQPELSLFAAQGGFSWTLFFLADYAGGRVAVRALTRLGARDPRLLAAAFFAGAATGSIMYALDHM